MTRSPIRVTQRGVAARRPRDAVGQVGVRRPARGRRSSPAPSPCPARTASIWLGEPIRPTCSSVSSSRPSSTGAFQRRVVEPLGGAHRVGRAPGDLGGELLRRRQRVLGHARHEAERRGLGARDHAAGVGQLLRDVDRHEPRQRRGDAHVRHQAPLGLHHRQPRVGRGEADVGAQRDLQPAAEAVAVDRGDHRRRQRRSSRCRRAGRGWRAGPRGAAGCRPARQARSPASRRPAPSRSSAPRRAGRRRAPGRRRRPRRRPRRCPRTSRRRARCACPGDSA